jgi:hypothetical protein
MTISMNALQLESEAPGMAIARPYCSGDAMKLPQGARTSAARHERNGGKVAWEGL